MSYVFVMDFRFHKAFDSDEDAEWLLFSAFTIMSHDPQVKLFVNIRLLITERSLLKKLDLLFHPFVARKMSLERKSSSNKVK